MYNMHIGFPRITFRSLSFIGETVMLPDPAQTYVLSHRIFHEELRSVINNYRTAKKQEDSLQPVKRLFKNLAKYATVSISQPGLLGASRELLFSERAIQRGASRVAAISELLSTSEVTFHIAITSQLDYVIGAFGDEARDIISERPPFSWKPVIEAIAGAAPERNFVVWNFDDPERIEEQFLCELLGQNLYYSDVDGQLSERYSENKRLNIPSIASLHRQLDLYEDMFEDDILSIREIDGVSMITPDYSFKGDPEDS
jgi:hypothetical protein